MYPIGMWQFFRNLRARSRASRQIVAGDSVNAEAIDSIRDVQLRPAGVASPTTPH
jgi:hypothetical protein